MPGRVTDDQHITGARGRERPRRERGLFDGQLEAALESEGDICRLYTPPMIAAVLGAPAAAVRHWIRGGLITATRRAASVEWFDFSQLVVGRRLTRLLEAGLSLREIDAQLADLVPGGAAAAARTADLIVADGRRLGIRRAGRLLGAGGQLHLGFYADAVTAAEEAPLPPVLDLSLMRFAEVTVAARPEVRPVSPGSPLADGTGELLDLADELEAAGEFAEAAEAVRAALQAGGPTAPVLFMLAELLYRAGDLAAARERYYATIEIDPDHLQARASLGCVLADMGEHDLALAALEGVLAQEPGYADAHWHMAGVLADLDRPAEARHHLSSFLALAPESPWARTARDRLDTLR